MKKKGVFQGGGAPMSSPPKNILCQVGLTDKPTFSILSLTIVVIFLHMTGNSQFIQIKLLVQTSCS